MIFMNEINMSIKVCIDILNCDVQYFCSFGLLLVFKVEKSAFYCY